MKRLIALAGRAGSGKNTVAKLLGAHEISFAEPLKKFCQEIFAFTDEQVWGPSECRNAPDERYYRGDVRFEFPYAPQGAVWVALSGGGHTLIDAADLQLVSARSWHLKDKGPGKNTDYVKTGRSTMLHRFLLAAPHGAQVDHINGDGLDNRRRNLRLCGIGENRRNERKRLPQTAGSKFKGVSWDRSRSRWVAKISVAGKTLNLGRFQSELAAAEAYDQAACKHFGSFARCNADLFLTPRYALQTLGTNWGRDCFPDVWADLGVRRALASNAPLVAITDCRFVNEAKAVRAAGGEVWRIVRPGAGLSGAAGLHPSEAEQESPEFMALVTRTIVNDGLLIDLATQVANLKRG